MIFRNVAKYAAKLGRFNSSQKHQHFPWITANNSLYWDQNLTYVSRLCEEVVATDCFNDASRVNALMLLWIPRDWCNGWGPSHLPVKEYPDFVKMSDKRPLMFHKCAWKAFFLMWRRFHPTTSPLSLLQRRWWDDDMRMSKKKLDIRSKERRWSQYFGNEVLEECKDLVQF